MTTKVCKACHIRFHISYFQLNRTPPTTGTKVFEASCIPCNSKRIKAAGYKQERTEEQRIKSRARSAEFRRDNLEQVKRTIKKAHQENGKRYRENRNPESVKRSKAKQLEKRKADPVLAYRHRIATLILQNFKKQGSVKQSSTLDILGCSSQDFYTHLVNTALHRYGFYLPDYVAYQIDHIQPISLAQTEDDIVRLNHYTNLQLLTAEDNRHKWDKLDWTNAHLQSLG